jgi:hypothetical protein
MLVLVLVSLPPQAALPEAWSPEPSRAALLAPSLASASTAIPIRFIRPPRVNDERWFGAHVPA